MHTILIMENPSKVDIHVNKSKYTQNSGSATLCPLRRLEVEPVSAVAAQFTLKAEDMPPDHQILMKRFQQNEEIRHKMDEKFGNNKEELIEHLWLTHKHYFRALNSDKKNGCAIEKWLENIQDSSDSNDDDSQDSQSDSQDQRLSHVQ